MPSTLQFGIKKTMYAYVKYVYEAPKNGLTVVSALSYSIKAYYQLEGKYTEWPNPQISGENRQSGLTD